MEMPWEYWTVFVVCFTVALFTTPLFRHLAIALDITDRPSARKVHTKPTPYLGGMAFHAAMTAALIYLAWFAPYVIETQDAVSYLYPLYWASTGFLLLGILDDTFSIPASIKLLVMTVLAVALVSQGFTIEKITSPFGGTIPLPWLGSILSVLWILTIVNAVNFVDGLDGLAAGVVFFASLAILVIGLEPWQNLSCLVALILMGSTLGFLPYNFSPAKIFMGDAGALFLGSMIAGSALASNSKGATVMSLSLPLVILSLPLLDTVLTVIRRGSRGHHFFKADREHLHHRIVRLGFKDRQAVLFVYGFCFFLSMSTILAAQLPDRFVFLFIFVYLGWVFWALVVFNALEHRIVNRSEYDRTGRISSPSKTESSPRQE